MQSNSGLLCLSSLGFKQEAFGGLRVSYAVVESIQLVSKFKRIDEGYAVRRGNVANESDSGCIGVFAADVWSAALKFIRYCL